LAISGQLSSESIMPSPSESIDTAPIGSVLQEVAIPIMIKMHNNRKKVVFIILN